MKRAVTIIEVASRAKVALSTVSRVLNGGYASAEVRSRVEKAASDLGYTPSNIARNLKMGRQGCIGVVALSTQGTWFMQLLGGIEEELADKTITALLGSLAMSGKYDAAAVQRWLVERRVDGLLFAYCSERERALVELAKKHRLPMVFVAPDEVFDAGPIFRARNRDAAYDIAEHLCALGHRRIAFVGGPKASTDTQERLRGLRDGLGARSIELRPANVVFSGTYLAEGGIGYAKSWLAAAKGTAPTAVVLANDALALGFLRTVLQHGTKVPEQVSVVGFDGTPEAALYWPGLTTADQPTRAMGKAATKGLLRMIESPHHEGTAQLDLPMTLIVRESTGAAADQGRKRTSPVGDTHETEDAMPAEHEHPRRSPSPV